MGDPPDMQNWLVFPHQLDEKIAEWQPQYRNLLDVDALDTYVGLRAYALTVTDFSVPSQSKSKCLFSVPHAHEPACTAACMNFVSQLLTGRHLDGDSSDLPREDILAKVVCCFIPDGNPDGRSRSPEPWWDGGKWSNDEFLSWMRGIDAETGEMWLRLDKWSTRDYSPARIGIVYEQISEHEFVEPNRCWESSFFRLIFRLRSRYEFDRHLDMHQTEFAGSDHNAMIILPTIQDELPGDVQERNQRWAEQILAAWREAGARVDPEIAPLGYSGEQRQYFVERWGPLYATTPTLNSEVQNNSPRTPPDEQRRLNEVAIQATMEPLTRAVRVSHGEHRTGNGTGDQQDDQSQRPLVIIGD